MVHGIVIHVMVRKSILKIHTNMTTDQKPRVIVVGAGWAGLGATDHLVSQGYEVTLLEAGAYPGGLVAGWQTAGGRPVEAGIHGFWYPYKIFLA